ncbi:MAG: 30S ribosomal protein S12 methylthiotransferase RimO [Muribaculaceae bacterium]|nr:30S ribosomal protein S12 methylthiotransferase RimO [Muribaculaceae bacterium]
MNKKTFEEGRIDIISLGCSKNLVDSERLLRRLETKGLTTAHDSSDPCGEWVIINTCGFIGDAKEESINMILQLAEAKKNGRIGHIAVMGCLSERYLNELKEEIPEVDRWYGKFNWNLFLDDLPDKTGPVKKWERKLTTPPYSTYLKISEGCNRFCAFCAIPLITGRHKSRPMEEIIEEVKDLTSRGVKEFNVIAQDLSSYGLDLYGNHALPELIERIANEPGVEWIRLHYAYPADFPMEILDVMNRHDNVCKYLDIALQHISDPVLSNMQRHITKEETLSLLNKIRTKVPDIKIRTTLMTGFPGEGEKEFEELLEFVKTQKFERMGAFAYCEEDDTMAAAKLDDNIDEELKQKRLDRLMELQESIAMELNSQMIGQTVKVLVERHEEDNSIGRSQWDSPEVDPEVIIRGEELPIGEFVEVYIEDALPFELIGTLKK